MHNGPVQTPSRSPYTQSWLSNLSWLLVVPVALYMIARTVTYAIIAAAGGCFQNPSNEAEFREEQQCLSSAEQRAGGIWQVVGLSLADDADWLLPLLVTLSILGLGLVIAEKVVFSGGTWVQWSRDLAARICNLVAGLVVFIVVSIAVAEMALPMSEGRRVFAAIIAALVAIVLATFVSAFFVGDATSRLYRSRSRSRQLEAIEAQIELLQVTRAIGVVSVVTAVGHVAFALLILELVRVGFNTAQLRALLGSSETLMLPVLSAVVLALLAVPVYWLHADIGSPNGTKVASDVRESVLLSAIVFGLIAPGLVLLALVAASLLGHFMGWAPFGSDFAWSIVQFGLLAIGTLAAFVWSWATPWLIRPRISAQVALALLYPLGLALSMTVLLAARVWKVGESKKAMRLENWLRTSGSPPER